jgi:hypothetical protein
MCEYRLYQQFQLYIESQTIEDNPNIITALNNLYYANYNITIISDEFESDAIYDLHTYNTITYNESVSETILTDSKTVTPNTIAIYINPAVTDIDPILLFEINKWFLYRKCRATYIDSIWICKIGILHEINAQIGIMNTDISVQINNICGSEEFFNTKLITFDYNVNTIPNIEIHNIEKCEPLYETIHIILATYERNSNMHEILTMIQNQTYTNTHLHILDNNIDTELHTELDNILDDFVNNMNITVHRLGINSNCFGRLTYIRNIMDEYIMEYIVLFDDDQIFESNWIENMIKDRVPLSTLSWYGKLFNTCDYWDSSITYTEIQRQGSPHITEFTYFGPGGCLFDINLFLFNEMYDYKKHSEDILKIDDIWLSFVFKKYLNIPFYRNQIHPTKCIDRNDHTKMTWSNIKNKKAELFENLSTNFDWDITNTLFKSHSINSIFERIYVLYSNEDQYRITLEKMNKMNICATFIYVELFTNDYIISKLINRSIEANHKSILILNSVFEFHDFFHYEFDKQFSDLSKYIIFDDEYYISPEIDCILNTNNISNTFGYIK